MEIPWQHADNLARFAVHQDGTADDRVIAPEFRAPISIGKHYSLRSAGAIVAACEQAAQGRLDTEDRKRAIGDIEALNVFRLSRAGDTERIARVNADILERGVLLALDEVKKWRHWQLVNFNAGNVVPDADQSVGLRIAQGFE